MVLEVDLALDELTEELLQVCHSSDSVGVETGIRGWPVLNRTEARGAERAAASEREVWQGRDRKGMKEAEEDLDFEVTGKVTVGSDGIGELIFLLNCRLPCLCFSTCDRVRATNDRQALLLHFNEVAGKLVWYGGNIRGDIGVRLLGTRSPQVFQ